MKKFTIPLKMFDRRINFYYDCTMEEFIKAVGWKGEVGDSEGLTVTWNSYSPDFWVRDMNNVGNIVHELVHCICHIHRITGVKQSEDSEEFFAYLMGYCFREIMGHFSKEKIKMEKKLAEESAFGKSPKKSGKKQKKE